MSEFFSPSGDERRGAVRYAQAVRQHVVLIVGIVALSLVAAAIAVVLIPKQYEATADISINPISVNDTAYQGFSVFRQGFDGSSAVIGAARAFQSPEIRQPAMAVVDPTGTAGISIEVAPVSQASIVTVTATASEASEAARSANAYATTAVAQRSAQFQRELTTALGRLRTQIAAIPRAQRETSLQYAALAQRVGELQGFVGAGDPTVRVASRAVTPTTPSWPRPLLTLVAVFLASLLLGLAIAVLMELANPRIAREEELRLHHRLPILARVAKLSQRTVRGYLSGRQQLPAAAWKGYRTLRASLAAAGPEGSFPRSILVTSASPGDGKTMTAVNLSIALATANLRVVLVDADVHRPMVATIFNIAGQPDGFMRALASPASTDGLLVSTLDHPRLQLLLSRPGHHAQARFVDTERIAAVLQRLQRSADVVVIDAPPIPEVAEAIELATISDVVVIAARLGHTRRDKLDQLQEMFARRGISPAGFVVTTRERAETESPYDYTGALPEAPEQVRPPAREAPAPREQPVSAATAARIEAGGAGERQRHDLRDVPRSAREPDQGKARGGAKRP